MPAAETLIKVDTAKHLLMSQVHHLACQLEFEFTSPWPAIKSQWTDDMTVEEEEAEWQRVQEAMYQILHGKVQLYGDLLKKGANESVVDTVSQDGVYW